MSPWQESVFLVSGGLGAVEVLGHTYECFGVHESAEHGCWVVTHLPTGRIISWPVAHVDAAAAWVLDCGKVAGFKTENAARAWAAAIYPLGNWRRVTTAAVEKLRPKVGPKMDAAARALMETWGIAHGGA